MLTCFSVGFTRSDVLADEKIKPPYFALVLSQIERIFEKRESDTSEQADRAIKIISFLITNNYLDNVNPMNRLLLT